MAIFSVLHQSTSMMTLSHTLNRSYKYYATYALPGVNDEVQTAAQSAKMQQGPAPGGVGVGGSAAAPPPPLASAATWHVPLQHCGVHWVQAGDALASALEREPLRLRVFRAHSKAYGGSGGAAPPPPPLGAGTGGPHGAWVSSTLAGEAVVDMSSLITMTGVRKHQPNTRCGLGCGNQSSAPQIIK